MYFCFFSITSFAQTVCSRKRPPFKSLLIPFSYQTKKRSKSSVFCLVRQMVTNPNLYVTPNYIMLRTYITTQ